MNNLESLLVRTHKLYPASKAQDYYKLLYQSCFGPQHLLQTTEILTSYFITEWNQALIDNSAPMIHPMKEDISLHQPLIRYHFNHPDQLSISSDKLLKAFLTTIKEFQQASIDFFHEKLSESNIILQKSPFHLSKGSIESYWSCGFSNSPESIHHSKEFNQHYQPHYRLVIPDLL